MKNIQQSNIFKNNIIHKRINRFKKNVSYIEEEFDIFDFNNNLKSNNIEELEFTNYLSSDKCQKYFLLLEICKKLKESPSYLDRFFIIDEFDSKRDNANRVYKIINIVNNKLVDRKILIYKFKNKSDPEIQFYIAKEQKELKLYLIDIYHIVIEAINVKIGKANRKKIYESRKKCKFDIKSIQDKINIINKKP